MMHRQKNIIFFLPLLKLVVKKLLELSYILKKVCIPRSFLVINVCNQGKTLCSPCIFETRRGIITVALITVRLQQL
jgi:hypothetical protein